MDWYKYVLIWFHRCTQIFSSQLLLTYGKFPPSHTVQLKLLCDVLSFMAVMGIIRLVTLLLHLSLYLNWFLCSLSTVWDSVKNRESSCGTRQEMWERQTPAGRSGGKPPSLQTHREKGFRLWWLGGQVIRCPCGSLLQSRVSH